MGDMDEEGQTDEMALFYDRYTENTGKQFCIRTWLSLEASGVFKALMLYSLAWAYGGQFGPHDFVYAEV